jgi:hypothetical protein
MDTSDILMKIGVFIAFAIYLWPIARILQKAGYSGWWCLLTYVPVVNFIMLSIFAAAKWPNLRDAKP